MRKTNQYPDFTGDRCQSYLIDPMDREIVDFAIKLGKPLVVEGEPGCGKTQLAHAIAEDLGIKDGPKIVPVKSTSRANDLLYRYNALGRLQDSQSKHEAQINKAAQAYNYVELEFLGKAIQQGEPSVVLIDEIDKADIDFADDLLYVIENFKFQITEIPENSHQEAMDQTQLGHWIEGPEQGFKPIVIFTSNRSKPLSKPFLRRCFYLELNFPNKESMLVDIVNANLAKLATEKEVITLETISKELIEAAVKSFLEIRKEAINSNVAKVPATAELIDWVHVLHLRNIKAEDLTNSNPPYWRLLFKLGEDLKLLQPSLLPK
ncbi:AAA family ATPase [Ketobacter sp.]|uniref:AAA family ATPase n=1 Tax=Ketobacter sp. TaxID=2083498 RepID=UPI000F295676|nr:MoxR family ATPase [Ketobacter sp.]RLU01747.1 MAG: MoxR family ATPase [Ketobacter sp.]